ELRMKFNGRVGTLLALCAAAPSYVPLKASSQIPRDARALVVHITYIGLPDQVEAYGAGIVIGDTANDLIIATAAHLLHPDTGLRVLLSGRPRDSLKPRIARISDDRDLAILLV